MLKSNQSVHVILIATVTATVINQIAKFKVTFVICILNCISYSCSVAKEVLKH